MKILIANKIAMQLSVFERRLNKRYSCYQAEKSNNEYNDSGDDGKEDPPVPIPNTEVKLFYAESTCRLLPGGQVIAAFQQKGFAVEQNLFPLSE